jgi:hypothetical protein
MHYLSGEYSWNKHLFYYLLSIIPYLCYNERESLVNLIVGVEGNEKYYGG